MFKNGLKLRALRVFLQVLCYTDCGLQITLWECFHFCYPILHFSLGCLQVTEANVLLYYPRGLLLALKDSITVKFQAPIIHLNTLKDMMVMVCVVNLLARGQRPKHAKRQGYKIISNIAALSLQIYVRYSQHNTRIKHKRLIWMQLIRDNFRKILQLQFENWHQVPTRYIACIGFKEKASTSPALHVWVFLLCILKMFTAKKSKITHRLVS